MVEIRGSGVKGPLRGVAIRAPRALARPDVGDAPVVRQGNVHRLGVGIVGEKRHVPENPFGAASRPLFQVNLQGIVVGHPVVLIFKDVGKGLIGPAGLRSLPRAQTLRRRPHGHSAIFFARCWISCFQQLPTPCREAFPA